MEKSINDHEQLGEEPLPQRSSRKREPGNNQDDDDIEEDDCKNSDEHDDGEVGKVSNPTETKQLGESIEVVKEIDQQADDSHEQSNDSKSIRPRQRYQNNRSNNRMRFKKKNSTEVVIQNEREETSNQQEEHYKPENDEEFEDNRQTRRTQKKKNRPQQALEEAAVLFLDSVASNSEKKFIKSAYGHNPNPTHEPKIKFDRSSLVSPNQITEHILVPKELKQWSLSEQGEAFRFEVQKKSRVQIIEIINSTEEEETDSVYIKISSPNKKIFQRAFNLIQRQFSSMLNPQDDEKNIPKNEESFKQPQRTSSETQHEKSIEYQRNEEYGRNEEYQQNEENRFRQPKYPKPNRQRNSYQQSNRGYTLRDIRTLGDQNY